MVEALRAAGAEVVAHDERFAQDVPDEEWLRVAGERAWVVLSKDGRIAYRATEWIALRESKVRAFFLRDGNATGKEMAELFVRHLPRIVKLARTQTPPFLARVTKSAVTIVPR